MYEKKFQFTINAYEKKNLHSKGKNQTEQLLNK